MKRILLAVTIMSFLVLCANNILHSVHAIEGEDPGIQLSKKTRRILSAEMNAIQNGLTSMAIALPAGKWNEIAEIAKKMNMTYIMKKKLTKKQLDKFYKSVPEGYRVMDSDFYEYALTLSRAAMDHDLEQVTQLFYKLNESCVKCHSKYAGSRFPGFKKIKD